MDADEAGKHWHREKKAQLEKKYSQEELSEKKKKTAKATAKKLAASLVATGKSWKDHFNNAGGQTAENKLIQHKRGLIKKEGGEFYHFKCNKCQEDFYVEGLGNKWEKPGAKYARKVSCRNTSCDNKENHLPRTDSRKSKHWTYMGQLVGDAREQLLTQWKEEVAAVAKGQAEKNKEYKKKWKNGKKKK